MNVINCANDVLGIQSMNAPSLEMYMSLNIIYNRVDLGRKK